MNSGTSYIAGPRLAAFALAVLLAGSTVYWVLRWPVASVPVEAAQRVSMAPVSAASVGEQRRLLAQFLGAGERVQDVAPAGLAARLVLSGVVATAAGSGAALISVDGKPARAYTVGSVVADGLVLQAVALRRAMLGAGMQAPVDLTLELKLPPR